MVDKETFKTLPKPFQQGWMKLSCDQRATFAKELVKSWKQHSPTEFAGTLQVSAARLHFASAPQLDTLPDDDPELDTDEENEHVIMATRTL